MNEIGQPQIQAMKSIYEYRRQKSIYDMILIHITHIPSYRLHIIIFRYQIATSTHYTIPLNTETVFKLLSQL